jgi:L-ascorbate metabolism protein UlaG (beta-lactamase superfamily)
LELCGAERALGHHWGTFRLTNEAVDEPPQRLSAALARAGVAAGRFLAARPGQVVLLS